MKKRFLSILTALSLALSLLPTAALASETTDSEMGAEQEKSQEETQEMSTTSETDETGDDPQPQAAKVAINRAAPRRNSRPHAILMSPLPRFISIPPLSHVLEGLAPRSTPYAPGR